MDLWIRSQNKEELILVNRLFITKYNDWEIVADIKEDNAALTLGYYKTKERALEVLDEIQSWLEQLEYGFEVYEMPKE